MQNVTFQVAFEVISNDVPAGGRYGASYPKAHEAIQIGLTENVECDRK